MGVTSSLMGSQVSLKSISSQGSNLGIGLGSASNSNQQIKDQSVPEHTPEHHSLSQQGMGAGYDPHAQPLWWIKTKILVFFSLGWVWTVGWIVLFLPLYSMPG